MLWACLLLLTVLWISLRGSKRKLYKCVCIYIYTYVWTFANAFYNLVKHRKDYSWKDVKTYKQIIYIYIQECNHKIDIEI